MTPLKDSDLISSTRRAAAYPTGGFWRSPGYAPLFLGLVLGIAITLLGFRFLGQRRTAADEPSGAETTAQISAQTVTVAPAQLRQVSDRLAITGTVQPTDLLGVTPQISGLQVRDVLVEAGDPVVAGQPLVILSDTELQTQLQQAQSEIEVAQAAVQQEQASLAQAEAELVEANANLQRYETLAAQGAVSKEELDSRATQAVTSRESVGVAQANLASAQATVRSRQSELARLRNQLSYTTVVAPTDGVVAERLASVGNVSSTVSEVVTLIRNNQLELAAEVPQAQLSQIQIGAPVRVTASTDNRIQVEGTVQEIQPLVDPQTRIAEVIIQLPASDRLRSGMFLTADVQVASRTGLTIPASAILPQPDGTTRVYVLGAESIAVARSVEGGTRLPGKETDPAYVEILQGLTAGEQVIVAGASYVQEGDVVTVAE